jgi:hypothetical protein
VAKNRARGNRQSRRVGWKIDVRLTRTLGIALQRKGTVGVSMPEGGYLSDSRNPNILWFQKSGSAEHLTKDL